MRLEAVVRPILFWRLFEEELVEFRSLRVSSDKSGIFVDCCKRTEIPTAEKAFNARRGVA